MHLRNEETKSDELARTARGQRVSVIVPTYDRALLLRRTVRSILDQTFSDLELVVVSDGPWTFDPSEGLADSRVRFLTTGVHHGRPAPARNVGIAETSGEIVAFCDDDDLWEPNKLEMQVGVFDRAPDVSLVHTHAFDVDANGRILGVKKPAKKGYDRNPLRGFLSLPNYWVVQSSVAVRRSALEIAGSFDERPLLAAREDAEWLIRLASRTRSRFGRVPLPLVRLRYCETSLSHRPDYMEERKLDCFFGALLEKGTLTSAEHARLVSNHNASFAFLTLRHGWGADLALRFARESWRAQRGFWSGVALAASRIYGVVGSRAV